MPEEIEDVNEQVLEFVNRAQDLAESDPRLFIACMIILSCACAMQAAELDATPFDDRCWEHYKHELSAGARALAAGGLPSSAPLEDAQRALGDLLKGFASVGDRHLRDLSAS